MMKIIECMFDSLHGPIGLQIKVKGGKAWVNVPGFDDLIVPEGCRVAVEFEAAGDSAVPVRLSLTLP